MALIKAIKSYLDLKAPREVYVPYPLAKTGRTFITWLIKRLGKIGVEIRLPPELMFMKNFYESQALCIDKLARTSYRDPAPEVTIFTELTSMIYYYLIRWKHLNRITTFDSEYEDSSKLVKEFQNSPETLVESMHKSAILEMKGTEEGPSADSPQNQ